ncbi:nucleotidyltransferase family protein [Rhodococcus sp. UNC363MFTsu5.1]|uniref:nucleotidyltransferase family protein n=1 Tax=Rhodococcus sp. UNC363MFTsu5.1 TaxID=1449069 RepID=UPI000482BFE9|nr:NTP transferase domain-containing protein [Rhodococcus sp. UNC363MFTsu5.1]
MQTPTTQHRVVGVLLAAGQGSRYGMPKVLAHQGAWLRTAVAALRGGGCSRVIVVLGAADTEVPHGAEIVYAPDWREGVGASLRAGLTAASADPGADYAAIHLVDLPDVHADAVARVIAAAAATESGLARAHYGASPGHPVVMARAHWAAVAATAAGDEGALPYLREHAGRVRRVDCGDLATGEDRDTS